MVIAAAACDHRLAGASLSGGLTDNDRFAGPRQRGAFSADGRRSAWDEVRSSITPWSRRPWAPPTGKLAAGIEGLVDSH